MGNISSAKKLKDLKVKVKYNFKGTKPGQLTVKKGQLLTLLGEPAQGWIKCGTDEQRQGLVPIAFLDLSTGATPDEAAAMQVCPRSLATHTYR